MQLEREHGLRLFNQHGVGSSRQRRGCGSTKRSCGFFAGVRQVETAIGLIRREDQGQLIVGAIPALAGAYIRRTTMGFLKRNPNVYCVVKSPSSQWITRIVITRQLDVGIVTAQVDNPLVMTEPLYEHPLLCIIPIGHPLAAMKVVRPKRPEWRSVRVIQFWDLHRTKSREYVRHLPGEFQHCLDGRCQRHRLPVRCSETGVSLVHPLFIAGMEDRINGAGPFDRRSRWTFWSATLATPATFTFISQFAKEAKTTAAGIVGNLKKKLWLGRSRRPDR